MRVFKTPSRRLHKLRYSSIFIAVGILSQQSSSNTVAVRRPQSSRQGTATEKASCPFASLPPSLLAKTQLQFTFVGEFLANSLLSFTDRPSLSFNNTIIYLKKLPHSALAPRRACTSLLTTGIWVCPQAVRVYSLGHTLGIF